MPPVRRAEAFKLDGGKRPLGIAALKDKIVQKVATDMIRTALLAAELACGSPSGVIFNPYSSRAARKSLWVEFSGFCFESLVYLPGDRHSTDDVI